jgi:hypothetical protein
MVADTQASSSRRTVPRHVLAAGRVAVRQQLFWNAEERFYFRFEMA